MQLHYLRDLEKSRCNHFLEDRREGDFYEILFEIYMNSKIPGKWKMSVVLERSEFSCLSNCHLRLWRFAGNENKITTESTDRFGHQNMNILFISQKMYLYVEWICNICK